MNTEQLIKEQTIIMQLKGKSIEVKIRILAGDDYDTVPGSLEDDTLPDYSDIMKAFESEQLYYAVIRVEAYALGFEGWDAMSGFTLFPQNIKDTEPQVMECVADNHMIDNAIEDLKQNIQDAYSTLKTALGDNQ